MRRADGIKAAVYACASFSAAVLRRSRIGQYMWRAGCLCAQRVRFARNWIRGLSEPGAPEPASSDSARDLLLNLSFICLSSLRGPNFSLLSPNNSMEDGAKNSCLKRLVTLHDCRNSNEFP